MNMDQDSEIDLMVKISYEIPGPALIEEVLADMENIRQEISRLSERLRYQKKLLDAHARYIERLK